MIGKGRFGYGLAASLLLLLSLASIATAAPGGLDTTFDGDGKKTINYFGPETAEGVAIQPDGKIVLVGKGGEDQFAVTRLNPDGSFDTTFAGDGAIPIFFPGTSATAYAVAIQPDGKIVVAGEENGGEWGMAVARVLPDGNLDTSFDGDGKATFDSGGIDGATAVALQPDGRIVLAGYGGNNIDFLVRRLNRDGSPDTSFDGDSLQDIDFGDDDGAQGVALQPDGKIVVAGFTVAFGPTQVAMVRFNPNGSFDPSFDGDGRKTFGGAGNDSGNAVLVRPDGRLIVVGQGDGGNFLIARLLTDGSLDPGFVGGGLRTLDFGGTDRARTVARQPDGKLVVGGYTSSTGDFAIARFTGTGAVDTTFDGDARQTVNFGGTDDARGMALQSNGAIVLGGATSVGSDIAVARLEGDPVPAPIPYPRPGSATPLRVPLVTAYDQCTHSGFNSTHVAPLTLHSCDPPERTSVLTMSNTGIGFGFVKLKALPGNLATPADEADVVLAFQATDVRCVVVTGCTPGNDYLGRLVLRMAIRMTDRNNGLGNQSATSSDGSVDVPVTCMISPGPAGSSCSVNTTFDTLVPGLAPEGKLSIQDLLSVTVLGPGPDGSIGSTPCAPTCGTGDEDVFLTEGLFLP